MKTALVFFLFVCFYRESLFFLSSKPTLFSKFQGTVNDEFTELYTGIMEMSLKDESLFVPDEDSVSSSDEESEEPSNEYI